MFNKASFKRGCTLASRASCSAEGVGRGLSLRMLPAELLPTDCLLEGMSEAFDNLRVWSEVGPSLCPRTLACDVEAWKKGRHTDTGWGFYFREWALRLHEVNLAASST